MAQCPSAVLPPVQVERVPGFVGAPFMAPPYTQVSVWIYTLEIGAGCPMKDGGRNELRPYGAGKIICCAPNAERFPVL